MFKHPPNSTGRGGGGGYTESPVFSAISYGLVFMRVLILIISIPGIDLESLFFQFFLLYRVRKEEGGQCKMECKMNGSTCIVSSGLTTI